MPRSRQRAAVIAASFAIAACADVEAPRGDAQRPAEALRAQSGFVTDPPGDLNAFFDCVAARDLTLVSAHRGGPGPGLPENSLEAIAASLAAAPALIEFDVAASADGVLFLMHDDTLDRTTTGAGEAAAKRWADIARLRLVDDAGEKTDFHPPTLEDALLASKDRAIVQIDFKRSARFEDVVALVRKVGAQDQTILIAYTMAAARKLHRLAPEMMISLSVEDEDALARAVAAGVPENRLMAFTGTKAPNPRLNAAMEARGVEVIFGTLGWRDSIDDEIAASGEEGRYAEIARTGVDVIATDRPAAAQAALTKAGRAAFAGRCGIASER